MAKTPSERMEDLSEAIRKLTDTDERLVKVQEERLVEARQVEQQAKKWDNLGEQLKESLLAPLKGLASAIPAPLRIMAKMPFAPMMKGRAERKLAKLQASAMDAGGEEPSLGGALTPSLSGVASAVTGGSIGVTADPDSRWGQMVEAFAGINSTLEMIAEASLELFHLEDISDFVGELATGGEKTEKKLEEIDENTEPKKVSKAKIKEDELEARKKKPSVSTIKKLGPIAPDWKKLLIGLATLGAGFGIAKALSYWKDVIVPAGGFKEWWQTDMWPTIDEHLKGWMDTIVPSFVTAAVEGLVSYINANKQGWIDSAKQWLEDWEWSDILTRFPGLFIGTSLGATIGGKIGKVGGIAGYVLGILLGAAVGGLIGYFTPEIIETWKGEGTGAVGDFFKSKFTIARLGGLAGITIAAGLLLAIPTGGLSLIAMLALIIGGAVVGALVGGLMGDLPRHRDEAEASMSILERDARLATRSWREKHITDPLSGWIDAVKGFTADVFNIETWQEEGKLKEAKKYLEDLELMRKYQGHDEAVYNQLTDEINELQEQIRLAEHPSDRERVTLLERAATEKIVDAVVNKGSIEGAARAITQQFEGILGQSMMSLGIPEGFRALNREGVWSEIPSSGQYDVDSATQQGNLRDRIRMLENRIEKSKGWFSNVYEGSDKEGRARDQQELDTLKGVLIEFTSVIGHSRPHLVTDIGQMYEDIGLKGFLKSLVGRGTFDVRGNIGGSTLELSDRSEFGRKVKTQADRAAEIIPIEKSTPAVVTDLGRALGVSHGKLTSHGFSAKDYVEKGGMSSLGGLMNAGKSMLDQGISLGGGSGSLSMSGSADLGDGVSGSAGFSVTGGGSGASVGLTDIPRLSLSDAPVWGGGDVGFNSMANVNTTNITQAKTRDVGMALAFDKRKNNRLGYTV